MPVEFKDYYRALGVPRTASDEQIRKAFRKLARQYHPDVAKEKKGAEEKFKEINEAYEVLGDPAKRKKYDTLGAQWNRPEGQPPPGWEQARGFRPAGPGGFEFHFGGTGFSDFFEQFFGGARNAPFGDFNFETAEQEGAPGVRGRDIEGDILVTLDEVLRGSIRPVTLRKSNPRTGATETHTFRVKIPAGVQEGQMIRLPSQGETGVGGGPPGDLYLRVKLSKHPDFRVRSADVYYDLELAPWEAVLGTQISVPTPDGPVLLRIPPGSTAGQQLRLRGKGLPAKAGGRGDFYAVISIVVPSQVTAAERAAWEQLAQKTNFNPRKPL